MGAETPLKAIRNLGVIAHIDAGKTTLSERFLFYSGKTHRIGDIDTGNTIMDYLDEERDRGITIVAAAASFNWQCGDETGLVHLIDTPGHIDFTAEVERSTRVSDGAVVIFSGVEGVEAQSEKVWRQSEHYHVPKLAFVNKLDRLGASFDSTVKEMRRKFASFTIIPFQLPIGIESGFSGVIDLLAMQAVYFQDNDGTRVERCEIPCELLPSAEAARDHLLTEIAELSDEIAELYLNEREIPSAVLKSEIRRLVLDNRLCPVFAGSAKKNIGVQLLLDAVMDFLPSPEDRGACRAVNVHTGKSDTIDVADPEFCGLVFKLVAGTGADLLYLRTYSGRLAANDVVVNTRTGKKVKVKRILRLYSKSIEAIDEVGPGDIVGIIGPDETFTGDTLCSPRRQVLLEKIDFPDPVISVAIEPRSGNEKERLKTCLDQLCREDPTLSLKRHENTGQLVLSGMGELHLEINTNRIRREFGLDARCGKPRVAFRETLAAAIETRGVFDKIIGETALHTEVDISFDPVKLEQGVQIEKSIKSGVDLIPAAWQESAMEALYGALRTGGNTGYSLIYIRATLKNIVGSPDKTTTGSVAGAVIDAVQKAIGSGTVLLEPVMKLVITASEDIIGEITGYLQVRRAVFHGIGNVSGNKLLHCEVPLAEMFGFSAALPKLSGGRASFTMEPCGYQEISPEALQRLNDNNTVKF